MSALFPKQICCLIVTYNPEYNLLDSIKAILNIIDKIIIVDNNSRGESLDIISRIAENSRVRIHWNQENVGIAKALNQGVAIAHNMGYEWVLTFDQDTIPFHDILNTITDVYALYPEKENIGAIGVNFINEYSKPYCRIEDSKKYIERDYLITAGCLLSINAFYEVGGFREDLFIDNVDIEYSLRLKSHGRISLITKKHGMIHKVGSPNMNKILGLNISSSNHGILRRYYMARNHVIMFKEYFVRYPYFIAKASYFFISDIFKILLVEDNKLGKLTATIKGIYEGMIYPSKNKVLLNKKDPIQHLLY